MVCFTIPKEELLNDPSIIIVDATLRTTNNDKGDHMYKAFGIVDLLVCTLERGGKKTGWEWDPI